MVATRTQHQQEAQRFADNEPEVDAAGRQVVRMNARPGQSRKTQTPTEAIARLWSQSNDKMREDWLKCFSALLASANDATIPELAALADEAYFEFHARCNPSKFTPNG